MTPRAAGYQLPVVAAVSMALLAALSWYWPAARLTSAGPAPDRWFIVLSDGCGARLSRARHEAGRFRLDIDRLADREYREVQLRHRMPLAAHAAYVVSFRARADRPRLLGAYLTQSHAPWATLGQMPVARLSREWQTFTWQFRHDLPSEPDAWLHLDFADSTAGVDLAQVRAAPLVWSIPDKVSAASAVWHTQGDGASVDWHDTPWAARRVEVGSWPAHLGVEYSVQLQFAARTDGVGRIQLEHQANTGGSPRVLATRRVRPTVHPRPLSWGLPAIATAGTLRLVWQAESEREPVTKAASADQRESPEATPASLALSKVRIAPVEWAVAASDEHTVWWVPLAGPEAGLDLEIGQPLDDTATSVLVRRGPVPIGPAGGRLSLRVYSPARQAVRLRCHDEGASPATTPWFDRAVPLEPGWQLIQIALPGRVGSMWAHCEWSLPGHVGRWSFRQVRWHAAVDEPLPSDQVSATNQP